MWFFYFDSIEMFYLFLIDNLVIYRENDLMACSPLTMKARKFFLIFFYWHLLNLIFFENFIILLKLNVLSVFDRQFGHL